MASDAFSFHGGRSDLAAAHWPDAPLPWLDLSTGVNPCRWEGEAGPVDWASLPSPDGLAGLEAAAAAAFGAPDLAIAALPGSEIGLRQVATLDLPRPWQVVVPCYGTHLDALPGAQRLPDVPERWTGTLLVANPSNPDGRIVPDLLDRARAGEGWLVVDEAFADAVPGASVLPRLRAGDRAIVFRSFGKFFGLAGVRLGFVAGAPGAVAAMRARLGAWPVSSAAIAIGSAAYRDRAWQAAMCGRLAREAAALDEVLRRHRLHPSGACPLFRLVDGPPDLFERLGRAGILVRPFADAAFQFRLGLPGSEGGLARLDAALG